MALLNEVVWDPCDLLLAKGRGYNYAVLVLNTSVNIPLKSEHIVDLWNNASYRLAADGGTDRWLEWKKENCREMVVANIDFITGDMDSIDPKTLEHFEKSKSTKVIRTPDQDETDFTKALFELKKTLKEPIDFVVVFCSVHGRYDQMIGNINTLHQMNLRWPEIKIVMLTTSVTWLLSAGRRHLINVPSRLRKAQEWCALLPVGNKANVTTSGLKWNLDNSKLEFGYLVSSSNTYSLDSNVVSVKSDFPLVWSMGIRNLLTNNCQL